MPAAFGDEKRENRHGEPPDQAENENIRKQQVADVIDKHGNTGDAF